MFRLDKAYKAMTKRLMTGYPQLFGPYSHRKEKDGPTLSGLSLKHDGEELVSAGVARGQMNISGMILSEAEHLLMGHPDGQFAIVTTPFGARVPFLYLKEPPQGRQ